MDEAGSWDSLHERFEVKRIKHNLYSLSRGIPPLTREQAELFSRAGPTLATAGGSSPHRAELPGFAISARRLASFQISAN